MYELEMAKDKVMMGAERRSMAMTDDEKKITAYHEGGHALVGLNMPQSDPLHKITIIPRGRALGVTMNLPERDKYGLTLTELTSKLAMLFGGRVAEELIFGRENVTTGASSDIQQATALARRMVMEFGMSPKLGRVNYRDSGRNPLAPTSYVAPSEYTHSEQTLREIDLFDRDDRNWLKRRHPPQGRLNAGQKVNAILTAVFALLFAVSGVLLWYGERNTRFRFAQTILIHDWLTYVSFFLFMGHLYLSVIHPRTRHSLTGMTRGWVYEDWAREHHAKWAAVARSEGADGP